jgi:seryl-tRNA synthetase
MVAQKNTIRMEVASKIGEPFFDYIKLEKQLQSEREKNAELQAELDSTKKHYQRRWENDASEREVMRNENESIQDYLNDEKEKVTKLRAALEYYANQCPEQSLPDGEWSPTVPDYIGEKARSVLAEIGDEK